MSKGSVYQDVKSPKYQKKIEAPAAFSTLISQGAVFEVRPGALGEGTTGGYVEVGNAHVAILDVPCTIPQKTSS